MRVFPSFFSQINCTSSLEQIENAIIHMSTHNICKIREITKNVDSLFASCSVQSRSIFFYNSFLPNVKISASIQVECNRISIWFELKEPIKWFCALYWLLSLITEILFIYFWILGSLLESAIVILPFGMLVFSYMLSYIGLKISSKIALQMISKSFLPELLTIEKLKFGI